MNSITLNLPYDLPESQMEKIRLVFESMEGWKGHDQDNCPIWFGVSDIDEQWLWASWEPSGLLFEGELETRRFESWIMELQSKLSSTLGFPVTDADIKNSEKQIPLCHHLSSPFKTKRSFSPAVPDSMAVGWPPCWHKQVPH